MAILSERMGYTSWLDVNMAVGVPKTTWVQGQEKRIVDLGAILDALLEFTGATAGWVGLHGPDECPTFPVRRGDFSEAWLTLQQGQRQPGQPDVRGLQIGEVGPTLLNDLSHWPEMGEPPLRNLLYCQLIRDGQSAGQIMLANKPSGFSSQDGPILLSFAHLISQLLAQAAKREAAPAIPLMTRLALDRLNEGVLVIDEHGALVYVNPVWLRWSGFEPDDLLGRMAPYPFWVHIPQLTALAEQLQKQGSRARPTETEKGFGNKPKPAFSHFGPFPFRRKNGKIFWCQGEIFLEDSTSRRLTFAFLSKSAAVGAKITAAITEAVSLQDLAQGLPFAVVLVDRHGQVLWGNPACERALALTASGEPAHGLCTGPLLRESFTPASAAALERLIRDPALSERGRLGSLIVRRLDRNGQTQDLAAHWLAVALPDGPGFLFAFVENWEDFPLSVPTTAEGPRKALRPVPEWLSLLVRPGGEIEFWDERWAKLTELASQEPCGMKSEWVFDQVFPEECDRNWVEDLLNQPRRRGGQAVLRIGLHARPCLCTFVPITYRSQDCWLLLVGEPELYGTAGSSVMRFVRPFARGLSHLLNSYLTVPIGLAEMAQDRTDLPAELASWFDQILESCQRAGQLIASLQDLAAETTGETQFVSLADLVRDFIDEHEAKVPERRYELVVKLPDEDVPVQVNRRMIRTVFRHLLSNAEHALVNSPQRRIAIRVLVRDDHSIACELKDSGEGLPTTDWTTVLAPFNSTKGPFAKDPGHAALEATGLGLTVSQHFLTLHGGRLELRSHPDEGTTATMILPRAEVPVAKPSASDAESESLSERTSLRKRPPA